MVVDGEKRVLDVAYDADGGKIVALPRSKEASPICVGRAAAGTAIWHAWDGGFTIEDTPEARDVAQQLLAMGLAKAA